MEAIKDYRERKLALDPTQSFIVQAPAGSGKTELLIQRFLTLLQHVKMPEEILAITFTKKAANEMRARVLNALKQAQTEKEPKSEHAKLTWQLARRALARDQALNWNLIDNPNQLHIKTIDALCAYLTKQLPLLAHFGSTPSIADQPVILYREAVLEVLTHLEENVKWSHSIAFLLTHLDNDLNKLHDLLVDLLAKRDQWLPYIHLDLDANEIRRELEDSLQAVISESLHHVHELFPKALASPLLEVARVAADHLSTTGIASPILACRDLLKLPGTTSSHLEAWLGLTSLLLTKDFLFRKKFDKSIGFIPLNQLKNAEEKQTQIAMKAQLAEIIKKLALNETLREALEAIFYLPKPHYDEAQWEILRHLFQVLKIIAAQLRVVFQQRGQIDFIENAQAALTALGNDDRPTDLALALDYQIRHILIDEFQDTSITQYQLLEKLIYGWEPDDGRTLFVVGDPMQSIYRFRKAEVGLFIRMMQSGIGELHLTPLKLSVNFRSTEKIVEWNNAIFKALFPKKDDMTAGAVSYSPSTAKGVSDEPSTIVLKGLQNGNELSQANCIVDIINEIKAHQPDERIAILVRSRSHLNTLIPALKKAAIPFTAIDIDPLAERQCIHDLLSLTCAMLHPSDRIAWLAILRAPWCGLSLEDLTMIAKEPDISIWEQLENPSILKQLSPRGQNTLQRILPILKTTLAERNRTSLRCWVESTWSLLGGPACLDDIADLNDAHTFFTLLDEFTFHNPLIDLDQLKEKIKALYANPQQDAQTLQIMTVHTAKGLEFDTVILPHLERGTRSDDKTLLSWLERPLADDQVALLLAPIHATGTDQDPIYNYIYREHRSKSDLEMDRLLYVATTRAKKHLYLLFNIEDKPVHGSFLDKLWGYCEKRTDEILISSETSQSDHIIEKPKSIKRLTEAWVNPVQLYSPKNIICHQQQNGFRLGDPLPIALGIVIHRILQQLSLHTIDWWINQSQANRFEYITCQLMQVGLPKQLLSQALTKTDEAIQTTISDERGKWILKSHRDEKSEFAITTVINNRVENLIIDRTFIDEEGICWIIDYKTSTLSHQDLETFLQKEQKKYLQKMHLYYQALQEIQSCPIRLGLYFPAISAWRSWDPSLI